MSGNLLQMFPGEQRDFWKTVVQEEEILQEIRLRVNQPVIVKNKHGEWLLDYNGRYTRERSMAYCAVEREIFDVLQHICSYSLYAYEDELSRGFVTVTGGHRVGITGQVVLEGEKVRTIKHFSGLNIRISHEIKGTADCVLGNLYKSGRLLSTLIISPPGCGKTTLLRDLVRQVSDGNKHGLGLCVGLVDERSEIAGCYQGIAQNDVGMRTDILDGCPKALGMMMLLRSMSPQVIAVDEIGSLEDMQAIHMASCCGCKILATIHGEDLNDVALRDGMSPLLREGLFERILILRKENEMFCKKIICNEKETLYSTLEEFEEKHQEK